MLRLVGTGYSRISQSGRINSVRNGTDLTDSATKLEILNLTQLIHLHFIERLGLASAKK